MKRSLATALAAMLAVATAACSNEAHEAAPAPTATVRSVTVATVQMRPIAGTLETSGVLVARDQAAVSSELSGYRVVQVLADEGDWVRQGQPLVRLDDSLLRSRIAQQRASLSQAQISAAREQSEANRVRGIEGEGLIPDEQIEQRRYEARGAQAAVQVARAQLSGLLTEQARLVIRAPISGRVLRRTVQTGQIANPGAEPMFRILSGGVVELSAEVPEDALRNVSSGQPARIVLSSGTELTGAVRTIAPSVDPQSKIAQVLIRVPAHPELRVGAFARAYLEREAGDVTAVPEQAIMFEAGGPMLTVIGPDNRARRMSVTVGARSNGWVELVNGPPAGTRVALGGASFVLNGDRVRPVAPPPAASNPRPSR